MYYFKKISLLNRRLKLTKRIGELNVDIEKLQVESTFVNRDKISILNAQIEAFKQEIIIINSNLEYLQNEKPTLQQKISNNSVNVGAKNESGTHIQFPPIVEK